MLEFLAIKSLTLLGSLFPSTTLFQQQTTVVLHGNYFIITTKQGRVYRVRPYDEHISQLSFPCKITLVTSGKNHLLFLTEAGQVYGSGLNDWGQLGLFNQPHAHKPSLIPLPRPVTTFSAGSNHSLFVTRRGEVYGCGNNHLYQLGLREEKRYTKPVLIPVRTTAVQVFTGFDSSFFVNTQGTNYVTGRLWCNDNYTFRKITRLPWTFTLAKVSVLYHNIWLLDTTGQVYSYPILQKSPIIIANTVIAMTDNNNRLLLNESGVLNIRYNGTHPYDSYFGIYGLFSSRSPHFTVHSNTDHSRITFREPLIAACGDGDVCALTGLSGTIYLCGRYQDKTLTTKDFPELPPLVLL